MYYRAKGKAVCADVIPFYEDGRFYLFYLRDYRDRETHGEGCPWCLLTTEDLVNYEDHGEVLPRGAIEDQDLYVFTGSCFKHNGEYHIFYTGHNPHKRGEGKPEQKIMLARSRDLLHWEKDREFLLEAPEWMEMHDYRDPYVYYDEDRKKFGMLIAGRLKGEDPVSSRGATFVLYSDDLYHWELQREPFYAPQAFFAHECPDLFKMGGWWYLIFSEFTDKVVTTYRMANSLDGPWITPKVNTFDGHAFYAAKTAFDGEHRYLFGWNCIKYNEKDNEYWQWGGTVIPHELVQAEDGTLYVKCPETVKEAYSVPVELGDGFAMGRIERMDNGWRVGYNSGRSMKLFSEMPENCKIEMDLTASDDIGDFGVLLRADHKAERHYAVKFDPKLNRMAFDKVPRRDSTVHIQADTERYCPMEPGVKHQILLIVEGSVVECYVDGKTAMSARMFDMPEGRWGVYAQHTGIFVENIRVSTLK